MEAAFAHPPAEFDWPRFEHAWSQAVRHIVLGAGAAHDTEVTEVLRRRANWAYLAPKRSGDRAQLAGACERHLRRAEPHSLAAELFAATVATQAPTAQIAGQLPHWLFAFDAAGIATFRALALLAAHPMHLPAIRGGGIAWLQAAVHESVRLWPTTLSILREITSPVDWRDRHAEAGTTFVIPSAFFTRDPARPYADLFTPSIWLDGTAAGDPGLIPFSAGPAICPGRDVVTTVGALALRTVLGGYDVRSTAGPCLGPDKPLPLTLDHTAPRLRLVAI